ncbi:MAG: hypothetical protein ACYCTL_01655 [Acidimicrobiales bacterium]
MDANPNPERERYTHRSNRRGRHPAHPDRSSGSSRWWIIGFIILAVALGIATIALVVIDGSVSVKPKASAIRSGAIAVHTMTPARRSLSDLSAWPYHLALPQAWSPAVLD